MPIKQRITPFLWFDGQAEEAANFYVSIFPNSKVGSTSRYGEAGPGPKGSVMTIAFDLDGLSFTASMAEPMFKLRSDLAGGAHGDGPRSVITGKPLRWRQQVRGWPRTCTAWADRAQCADGAIQDKVPPNRSA
jgi:hypothetical protein